MKTISTLYQRPEFLKKLPKTLKFLKPGKHTIITSEAENCEIKLGENTHLNFITILNTGWNKTKKLTFNFEKPHAQLHFFALILGQKNHNFPLETLSNHISPHTKANYSIRSVMFDHSKINYKGNLAIHKNAQQSETSLAHHSLIMSKDAEVNTIPCLEIEADDVKAGHSATVGKVDEELLFYLQSRGIKKETAQNLLIKSFFKKDLERITDHSLRCLLCEEIDKAINMEEWEYGINCID